MLKLQCVNPPVKITFPSIGYSLIVIFSNEMDGKNCLCKLFTSLTTVTHSQLHIIQRYITTTFFIENHKMRPQSTCDLTSRHFCVQMKREYKIYCKMAEDELQL